MTYILNTQLNWILINILMLTIAFTNVKAIDQPGLELDGTDIDIEFYEDNLIIYNASELVQYSIDTKSYVNSFRIKDIDLSNSLRFRRYKYSAGKLFTNKGDVFDIEEKELFDAPELHLVRLIRPFEDEFHLAVKQDVLYKVNIETKELKELFKFPKEPNEFYYQSGYTYWMDSKGDLYINKTLINSFNYDPVFVNVNFKETKDKKYLVISDNEKFVIIDLITNQFKVINEESNEFVTTANEIYYTKESQLYKLNPANSNIEKVNTAGELVLKFCLNDGEIIFYNEKFEIFTLNNGNIEFITTLHFGLPLKIKLFDEGYGVISIINPTLFSFNLYDNNGKSIIQHYYSYKVSQREKLPIYMDNQVAAYVVEDTDVTSITFIDLGEDRISQIPVNNNYDFKIVNYDQDLLWIYDKDSNLTTINVNTGKVEETTKIDLNAEFIQFKNKDEFFYLNALGDEEFEFGLYNLEDNSKKDLLTKNYQGEELILWTGNIDYPITVDTNSNYVTLSNGAAESSFNYSNGTYDAVFSNSDYNYPTPLMPYKVSDNKYIIFYRDGSIMTYDNSTKEKIFIHEDRYYTIEDSVYIDYGYERKLTASDINNQEMIYNYSCSITRKDRVITSVEDYENELKIISHEIKSLAVKYNEEINLPIKLDIINSVKVYNQELKEINSQIQLNKNFIKLEGFQKGVYYLILGNNHIKEKIRVLIY